MSKIKKNKKHFITFKGLLKCTVFCTIIIALFIPSTVVAQPNWQIQLKIASGSAHNYLILGVDKTATDGFDNLWETHALFGGDIRSYFSHEEWDMSRSKLWRDIKSNETGTSKIWPIIIDIDPDSSLLNSEFMITWNLSNIPREYTISLLDETTGQEIDMRAAPSHSFIFTTARTYSVKINIP